LGARELASGDLSGDRQDVRAQSVERSRVGLSSRANRHVYRWTDPERRQEIDADEIAKAPLEAVAVDGGVPMARDDDAHAWMSERGIEHADVEVHGPDSLPLFNGRFQVGSARQSIPTRETESVVMRRRTCSEA
jgi:hypothetical protein